MGLTRGGGFIGRRAVPSQASAIGVWHLTEAESARRDSIWPLAAFSSPASISGLQLWLDGSDSSTLYDASVGGGLSSVNAAVGRWEDKSGNSRHFTQDTASVRPVRRSSVKNGLGAVEFTNDWLVGNYTYTVGSLFVVWNHPTTVTGDTSPAVVSMRASSANKTANSSLAYTLMLPSASNVAVDPSPAAATFRLNAAAAGAGFTSFSTGVAARTTPDRWQHTNATFTAVAGVKAMVLGADTFSTVRFMQNGHIGEIIAYDSALTASQVLSVEGYLISKWGLA